MWAYIKENKLQDPKNKQMIKCDEKLQKVHHFIFSLFEIIYVYQPGVTVKIGSKKASTWRNTKKGILENFYKLRGLNLYWRDWIWTANVRLLI